MNFLSRTPFRLLAGVVFLLPLCRAQIAPRFSIATVAGIGTHGFLGDGGPGIAAELNFPQGLAFDSSGNLYIADCLNHRVRKLSTSGSLTTVAGNGEPGYSGDGGPGTSARLTTPCGLAIDKSNNLYISDSANHVIRKLTAAGTISTVAGTGFTGFSGDGGAATAARLSTPIGIALDAANNLYIADTFNHRIRKVGSDGTITTFAGTGLAGYAGDGGAALDARLNNPEDVAVDSDGNVLVADTNNHAIRRITPTFLITTLTGGLPGGYAGDGGPAANAKFYYPKAIDVDSSGRIAIADTFNSRIRLITDGIVFSIAGDGGAGEGGDGGPALQARLRFPSGIAFHGDNLYLADDQNSRVRRLFPDPGLPADASPLISSAGVVTSTAFGGMASAAPGSWIEIYGRNLASASRAWAADDFQGAAAPTGLEGTRVTIGGRSAFVAYVSPTQVNVQVPADVALGAQALTVTTLAGTSPDATLEIAAAQPGLLALPAFQIAGKQYVVATTSEGTYALPAGAVPGALSRPARPGETITLYGVGFGPVSAGNAAGEVVRHHNSLVSPVEVRFGDTPALVSYSGLALDAVGLYQLNVVVPPVTGDGPVPLTISVGGIRGSQTLFTSVQN